jgi:hypothetical protein
MTKNFRNPLSGIAFLQSMRKPATSDSGSGMLEILRALDEGNATDVRGLAASTAKTEEAVAVALKKLAMLDLVERDSEVQNLEKFVLTDAGTQMAGKV